MQVCITSKRAWMLGNANSGLPSMLIMTSTWILVEEAGLRLVTQGAHSENGLLRPPCHQG